MVFFITIPQLQAADEPSGDTSSSDEVNQVYWDTPSPGDDIPSPESGYVEAFLNNPHLIENVKLLKLAEESLAGEKYDDAIDYANESIKYARLSDEYVALQMKIMETDNAIAEAETQLDRAKQIQAPRRYPEIYERAETAFNEAHEARSGEDWDKAGELAHRVVTILGELPAENVLPAQYLVKNWFTTKDCLWNIAAKPQVYGNPWQWRVLYNANRNKLPKPGDPDLIEPGLVLDIPSIKGEIRAGLWSE